jgi:hypothetical protein
LGERPGLDEPPWGREVSLTDPDHNRLRVAEPVGRSSTVDVLTALEHAMWDASTRGDRSWMDAHLTEDFTEFGFSGRAYDRADILDTPVGTIDATLADMEVRPVGRDAALVTYRSQQPRGAANRASVWRRADGRWRMAFHQGTPTG